MKVQKFLFLYHYKLHGGNIEDIDCYDDDDNDHDDHDDRAAGESDTDPETEEEDGDDMNSCADRLAVGCGSPERALSQTRFFSDGPFLN